MRLEKKEIDTKWVDGVVAPSDCEFTNLTISQKIDELGTNFCLEVHHTACQDAQDGGLLVFRPCLYVEVNMTTQEVRDLHKKLGRLLAGEDDAVRLVGEDP